MSEKNLSVSCSFSNPGWLCLKQSNQVFKRTAHEFTSSSVFMLKHSQTYLQFGSYFSLGILIY